MERKAFSFQLETCYQEIYRDEQTGGPAVRFGIHKADFTADKRSDALGAAKRELNKTLKEGLGASGGSTVKLIVAPSAIKQVSIIDINKMEQEHEAEIERKAAAYDEATQEEAKEA